jgi:hypothetical protein
MSPQELESMLQAARGELRRIEAPARVEAALLAAFRARVRRRWMAWAVAVAAAVVMLSGAVAWRMTRETAPKPALVKLQPPAPQPLVVKTEPPAPANPARRIPRRRPLPRPAEEVTTGFLPLEDAPSLAPIESAQVVRVHLPRAAMMRFGLPVNQDRMMEPVKADVVFAQDGIARAIRFVK